MEDELDQEPDEPKVSDNLKKAKKDRKTRRLLLVLVAGLVVAGLVTVKITRQNKEERSVVKLPSDMVEVPRSSNEMMKPPLNPVAENLHQGAERMHQIQAMEEGVSYIAPPPLWEQLPVQPQQPAQRQPMTKDPFAQQKHEEERNKAKQEYAKALMAEWSASPEFSLTRFPVEVTSRSGESAPVAAAASSGVLGIPAGTRFYATISGAADSYVPGPVRAVIQDGPLAGAVLLGQFTVLPNDRLILTFNRIGLSDKSYDIQAIALDANDELPAVTGEVDPHYIRRFVLPLAVNLMAAYGQSFAYGTDIAVTSAGVVVGNNDISETDRWIYALGQAGLAMLPALGAANTQYAQVILHDGQGIGVMLLKDI